MLPGLSPRPPDFVVVQTFSREKRDGGRVRFPRDAPPVPRHWPTSPDEPRSDSRASPTAHAWTRPEPPRPPSLPAAVPPPVADRAPLDPRRALFFFAAYRKSLTKLTFQTRSKRASLPVPGADTPIRRAEPRPPAGVRAMHRDRAPRAPVDARAAPRRARARARRSGERAEPERRGEKKESYCAFRRRATAVATAVRSPQSGLRLR